MDILKTYEIKVLHLLLSNRLTMVSVDALLREAKFVRFEETGSGYFLTLEHPSLPKTRFVFDDPIVIGHVDGVDCGFVVFVENEQLTIECHSWGAMDVPNGFREKDNVLIKTTSPREGML